MGCRSKEKNAGTKQAVLASPQASAEAADPLTAATAMEAAFAAQLQKTEAAQGAESEAVADLLDQWVELRWRSGRSQEKDSQALTSRAYELRRRLHPPGDLRRVPSLQSLAITKAEAGDNPAARELFEEALAIRRRSLPAGDAAIGETLHRLANVQYLSGQIIAARRLYEEALAIREKALGPNDPVVADSLDGVATSLRALGSLAEARPLAERSLAIRQRQLGPRHLDVAYSTSSLAFLLSQLGDFTEARTLFERSLSITREHFGPRNPLLVEDLFGLAGVTMILGDQTAAMQEASEGLDIWRRTLGPDHPNTARGEFVLGLMTLPADRASGRRLVKNAHRRLEQLLGQEHAWSIVAQCTEAWIAGEDGDWKKAVELGLRAADSQHRFFLTGSPNLTRHEALNLLPPGDRCGLDIALRFSVEAAAAAGTAEKTGPPPEWIASVWETLIRTRARWLDEAVARQRALRDEVTPEVHAALAKRDAAWGNLAKLATSVPQGPPDAIPSPLLASAHRDFELAERQLATASAPYRSLATERRRTARLHLSDLRTASGAKTALVGYVRYNQPSEVAGAEIEALFQRSRPAYLALVLPTGSNTPRIVPLGAAAPIDTALDRWHRAVSRPPLSEAGDETWRELGKTVRKLVWDPLTPYVEAARLVLIVPDGELFRLDFQTLPAPSGSGGSFLAETAPAIHYLTAERQLVRIEATEGVDSRGSGLLIAGAPDFDSSPAVGPRSGGPTTTDDSETASLRSLSPPCLALDKLHFDPLPGTGQEIQQVSRIWTNSSRGRGEEVLLLRGERACEGTLRAAATGRRVIHLATHGFYLPTDCQGNLATDLPLLTSGLALAGANRRRATEPGEDGILFAAELAGWDLSGVEWVVLSGCDTGIGATRAREGVLGLRRAIEVAGARSLILSLWAVDDRAAIEWINALYRHRLTGASTADAVQRANREILARRRAEGRSVHPYYWGAFIASGDWR